jgi:hypothetical protein
MPNVLLMEGLVVYNFIESLSENWLIFGFLFNVWPYLLKSNLSRKLLKNDLSLTTLERNMYVHITKCM